MSESILPMGVGRNGPDDVVARAPDFDLYGLDESWTGPRWIAGMSGPGRLATFSLGHLSTDRVRGVRVTTMKRDRYDRWRSAQHHDAVDAVAMEAADDLLAATLPDPDVVMGHPEWIDDIYDYASRNARRHRSWPEISWLVDDAELDAVHWRFAAAWTGFTTALPELYVVVTAVGVDPAAVRLRRLTDATLYGFQLGVDITIRQMATGAPPQSPDRRTFHPDYHAARQV